MKKTAFLKLMFARTNVGSLGLLALGIWALFFANVPMLSSSAWLGGAVLIGIWFTLVGLQLIYHVLVARRITGRASLVLLWRFWESDQSYRYMTVVAQRHIFRGTYGDLSAEQMRKICEEGRGKS